MGHFSLNGPGIYGLMGWVFRTYGVAHLNGWDSHGKLLFSFGKMLRNAGLQGNTLSGHHMTTGFGTFEPLTSGLLQRGWERSPPKACFTLLSMVNIIRQKKRVQDGVVAILQ